MTTSTTWQALYPGERRVQPAFLEVLRNHKLNVTDDAIPRRAVFPRCEPMVRVKGFPLLIVDSLEPHCLTWSASRLCSFSGACYQGSSGRIPVSDFWPAPCTGPRRRSGDSLAPLILLVATEHFKCSCWQNLRHSWQVPAHSWVMSFVRAMP